VSLPNSQEDSDPIKHRRVLVSTLLTLLYMTLQHVLNVLVQIANKVGNYKKKKLGILMLHVVYASELYIKIYNILQ
jgi:hypothetical protein